MSKEIRQTLLDQALYYDPNDGAAHNKASETGGGKIQMFIFYKKDSFSLMTLTCPLGVNLIALLMRLLSIWVILAGSLFRELGIFWSMSILN